MSEDLDKINEIFRAQDERTGKHSAAPGAPDRTGAQPLLEGTGRHVKAEKPGAQSAKAPAGRDKGAKKPERRGKKPPKAPAGGEKESERDYRPVRQSREYRSGCLGGIMYFVFILCVSVVLACVAWMAASDMLALNKEEFTAKVTLPADIFTSETVEVVNEDGETEYQRVTHADIGYLSDTLKEAGLIEYQWLFELFCKVATADEKVDPGEYELSSHYDYRALIQNMRTNSASSVTVDVTFPEGFSMYQIFMKLEEEGVCSYEDLMESAANDTYNYSFLDGREPGDAASLEGYLFPDTYQFYVGMQASSAINKFLVNFYNRLSADMINQAANLNMSIGDIVKIASYIEKEAANDEERATIASVIYNRLSAGMSLGIDATILYRYPEHEGAPTAEMLAEDDPYNTRISVGLTPTPICSPGMASLLAALNPENTNYYYYALDTETGTHRFFHSAEEHAAFVATQDYDA